jgi:hypothetical protein
LKVLQVFNLHRFRGGADNATLATVELLQEKKLDVIRLLECRATPGNGRQFAAFQRNLAGEAPAGPFPRLDGSRRRRTSTKSPLTPWILPVQPTENSVVMSCMTSC